MTRHRLLSAVCMTALLGLAGCQGESAPTSKSTSGCIAVAAPTATQLPIAVMVDVAGPPQEFLLGSPDGRLQRVPQAGPLGAPAMWGAEIAFTSGTSTHPEVRAGRPGECSHHVADGYLAAAEPGGGSAIVVAKDKWHLVNSSGRLLATLPSGVGNWTGDGHFVGAATDGLGIWDAQGNEVKSPALKALIPFGASGPSHELVQSRTGLEVMDIRDFSLQPVPLSAAEIQPGSESPDGKYVIKSQAGLHLNLVNLQTLASTPLPQPGPSTGFRWSPDSKWLAIATLYGGVVYRPSDGKTVDTGSLVVTSW